MSGLVVELNFFHVVGGAVFFLGVVAGFGKVLLRQFERHMDERAYAQRELLVRLEERIEDRLDAHLKLSEQRMRGFEDQLRTESARLTSLDSQFRALQDMLAMRFVQREDFIRFASSIDNKIDRLGELFTRFTMPRD